MAVPRDGSRHADAEADCVNRGDNSETELIGRGGTRGQGMRVLESELK